MRDYREAKAGVAEEIRGALRALGVGGIVVKPLDEGWKIEGGADVTLIIAGSSDAPSTARASLGSVIPW